MTDEPKSLGDLLFELPAVKRAKKVNTLSRVHRRLIEPIETEQDNEARIWRNFGGSVCRAGDAVREPHSKNGRGRRHFQHAMEPARIVDDDPAGDAAGKRYAGARVRARASRPAPATMCRWLASDRTHSRRHADRG